MRTHFKSVAYGFVGTVIAAVILTLGYTAYVDHNYVRALVQIETQREQAQRPVQPQAPPPAK